MRPDPRCPSCHDKVSATAQWCMHCGRDFETPVDASELGADGEAVLAGSRVESTTGNEADTGNSGFDDTPDVLNLGDESGGRPVSDLFGRLFAFVQRSAQTRGAVVLGVPTLVWLATAAYTGLVVGSAFAAALFAYYLFTRPGAQSLLAASLSGTGAVLLGVQAVAVATRGAPLVPGVGWLLFVVGLFAAGNKLRKVDV